MPALEASDAPIDIEAALSAADAKLGRLIRAVMSRIGPQRPHVIEPSPFAGLVRAIVYQSISAKGAAAIHRRLQQAMENEVTPERVAALPLEAIKAFGLSAAKAASIHNLAAWFTAHRAIAESLAALPDDRVIETLVAIPGIGLWTAHVFLIFSLGRMDVVPASDLGIRRGVQLIYRLKELASPALVERKARRWRPYRSTASIYLWYAVRLKLGPADLRP